MNKFNILKLVDEMLLIGLPLLFFYVDVMFYLKTYDSAMIKITFMQYSTAIIFFLWTTKYILLRKLPFNGKNILFAIPIFMFLISGIVSFIHSPFKIICIDETLRRICYSIIGLITLSEVNDLNKVKRITKWLLASLFFVAFYALLQYIDLRLFATSEIGLDPFVWRGAFGNRIFTTFGNPNFVGNFLVIMIPVVLSLYFKNSKKILHPVYLFAVLYIWMMLIDYTYEGMPLEGLRAVFEKLKFIKNTIITINENAPFIISLLKTVITIAALLFIIMQPNVQSMLMMFLAAILFINLVSTDTKGAYIGFTAGVVITYSIYFLLFLKNDTRFSEPEKKKLKKIFLGSIGLFTVAAISVILGAVLIRPVSVKFRIFTWLGNWEMAERYPWLGNGVGSFKANYPAYRRPEIIILEGRSNTETDHVENEYQEILSDEGIPGLAVFLWMVFLSLYYGFKRLKIENENSPVKFFTLAYLASWMAALTHWNTDVSIRFVSSGIYTCFLPAIVMNLSQISNIEKKESISSISATLFYVFWAISVLIWVLPQHHIPQSPHWPYFIFVVGAVLLFFVSTLKKSTRKIVYGTLAATFGVWWLRYLDIERKKMPPFPDSVEMHVVATLFMLQLLLFITETFENGSEKNYENIRLKPSIYISILPSFLISLYLCIVAVNWFRADIAHNRAIFFSKNAIWKKLPEYENRIRQFPAEFRNMYEKVGGALEHYEVVNKLNPTFPMSYYFTGNVYSDWGAEYQRKAIEAYNTKRYDEASRYKEEALKLWDSALEAYRKLKLIMPNYVQSHHQTGIIMQRIADMFEVFGLDFKKYDMEAIRWFKMYNMIDPVFPPNYYLLARSLERQGYMDEAERYFKMAVYFNDKRTKVIYTDRYPDRCKEILLVEASRVFSKAEKANTLQANAKKIEDILKTALEYSPADRDALSMLIALYARTNQTQKLKELGVIK